MLTIVVMCLMPSPLSATPTDPVSIVSRLREMNPFKKNALNPTGRLLLACTPLALIGLLAWRKEKHVPTLTTPSMTLALAPSSELYHTPVIDMPTLCIVQEQPTFREQLITPIKLPTIKYAHDVRTELPKMPQINELEQKLAHEVKHQLAVAATFEHQEATLESAATHEKEATDAPTTAAKEEPHIEQEQTKKLILTPKRRSARKKRHKKNKSTTQATAQRETQQAEMEQKKVIELETERLATIAAQEKEHRHQETEKAAMALKVQQQLIMHELAERQRQAQHDHKANEQATKLISGFKMLVTRKKYKAQLQEKTAALETEQLAAIAAQEKEYQRQEAEKAARALKAEQERRAQQMALFATTAKEWLTLKRREKEAAAQAAHDLKINEQAIRLTHGFKTLIAHKKYRDHQAAIASEKERLAREQAEKKAGLLRVAAEAAEAAAALERERIEQEKSMKLETERLTTLAAQEEARRRQEAAITAEKEREQAAAQAAAQEKERQRKETEKSSRALKAERERLAAIAVHEKEIQRQEAEKAQEEARETERLKKAQEQMARQRAEEEERAAQEKTRQEAAAIEAARARERAEKALKQLRHKEKKADKKEHLRQIQEHIRQRLKSIKDDEAKLSDFIEPYAPDSRKLTTIELKALDTLFNEIAALEPRIKAAQVTSSLMLRALINAKVSSKKTALYYKIIANCMTCITYPGTDLGAVLKSLPGYRTLYLEPSIREMVVIKAMLAKVAEFGPCLGLYDLAPEHLASIITANGVYLGSTDANIRFPLACEIESLYNDIIRAMPKEELSELQFWLTGTKGLSHQQQAKRVLHQPAIDRALKLIREEVVRHIASEPVCSPRKQEELV